MTGKGDRVTCNQYYRGKKVKPRGRPSIGGHLWQLQQSVGRKDMGGT